jgi:hypothetical protein
MFQIKNKNQDGFVALFTVLITSVILAMVVGLSSISLKEIVLSGAASEGSKAFYAADSGIECALYLEWSNLLQGSSFATCNGNTFQITNLSDFEADDVYLFNVPFGEDAELCANITVKTGITNQAYTKLVESKGSNTSCEDMTNPKRVERSIRITYN